MIGGLRAGMGYCGAKDVAALKTARLRPDHQLGNAREPSARRDASPARLRTIAAGSKRMITRDIPIRVRYYETDCMGIVHHSNYVRYYETARTEMLREFGTTYQEMEREGVMLPVLDVAVALHHSGL